VSRSPMLYAHYKGSVANNPDGQQVIVYLRSTIEAVVGAGLKWTPSVGRRIG